MEESAKQDLETLMIALHRVNREWPNTTDIQNYIKAYPEIFPFDSIEAADAAVERHHEAQTELGNIRELCRILRFQAFEAFANKYMAGVQSYPRGQVREHIDAFLTQEDFAGLEVFLGEIVRDGHEKAVANLQKQDRGNTIMHILAGVFGLLEIAVLLLVLNACSHGFQTIVVSAIGLIYCNVCFYGSARHHTAASQFTALADDTTRIRKLLKDPPLRWDIVLEVRKTTRDLFAKETVRLYIRTAKLAIMQLICFIALIVTSL